MGVPFSSPSQPVVDSQSPESENPVPELLEKNASEKQSASEKAPEDALKEGGADEIQEGGEDENEEGECGFCLFMKGGGCKETFVEWEKCVEMGEQNKEDIVEKCFQATAALKKCMEAHSDYYGPLLQAEKDAEEEFAKQVEEEKNSGDGDSDTHKNQQPEEKNDS